MKTALFFTSFLFVIFSQLSLANASTAKSAYTDMVVGLDRPYYYGDDGEECKAKISDIKISLKRPVTNSIMTFKAKNDPSLERHCLSGTWTCSVAYDAFEDIIIPNTLDCDYK